MEKGLDVEEAVKNLGAPDQSDKGNPKNDGENVKGNRDKPNDNDDEVLDLALIKSDPDKLYPIIYYALKKKLKEWGQSMAERPGACPILYKSQLPTKHLNAFDR